MRLAALFIFGTIAGAGLAVPAPAAPIGAPMTQAAPPTNNIIEVARCPRGTHYARAHRNRHGNWVHARCVRNRLGRTRR
jgi:hypothetical protein